MPASDEAEERRRAGRVRTAKLAWAVLPALGAWGILAYLLPSPIGVYLPFLPVLFLAVVVGLFFFGVALLRSPVRWNPAIQRVATVSFAAGLALAGVLGGIAGLSGCPTLSPFTTAEPGGWMKVSGPAWTASAAPVLFFYGSVACPYCSASSWAILSALERFGNVSGVRYDHSSPTDVFPNTPSVVLPDLVLSSPYVSLDLQEGLSDTQIQAPTLSGCPEQAYVSAFDSFGGVPFLVVGGTFVHPATTLVDPGTFSGLNVSTVAHQVATHSGAAWNAIATPSYTLTAILVAANGDEPAAVATNPNIAPILGQIR